jgi:GntR family transcriptional regulator / MocR family aminotransferase
MRAAEQVDLPLAVDPSARTGAGAGPDLRQQVAEQLREAIRNGSFAAGGRLPSSRALAGHLGVSRATVVAALAELDGEGWVESRHGSGTYVAAGIGGTHLARPAAAAAATAPRARGRTAAPPRPVTDLRPGQPDVTGLVDAAWRRAWREASAAPVSSGGLPLAGLDELRAAIAEHVRRARGLPCQPNEVIVTAGAGDAFRLLADALGVNGRAAAVEDPGYPAARAVLALAGARLHPVPVDDDGVIVDALAGAPADTRLLYLTPSHQYPLGGRLPVQRRLAVLDWAAARDALVVEDDYDSEFRFGAAPVPALASLDAAGRVAYVGTLSKAMCEGLRVAYTVASPDLVDAILAARQPMGMPVSEVVQRALASYLRSGGLRRHIARQRRVYAERRARLVRRLAGLDGVTAVRGLDAGLHAAVSLTPDRQAAAVVAAAARAGVLVADLDQHRMAPDPSQPGFVLGYGHVTAADLDLALDRLAAILR